MEGIRAETKDGFSDAKAHMSVDHKGHLGGFELASGFSGVGEPVLQQRLIDAAGVTVSLKDSQPHDIIFVALSKGHGKLLRYLRANQNGGAVDGIVL